MIPLSRFHSCRAARATVPCACEGTVPASTLPYEKSRRVYKPCPERDLCIPWDIYIDTLNHCPRDDQPVATERKMEMKQYHQKQQKKPRKKRTAKVKVQKKKPKKKPKAAPAKKPARKVGQTKLRI